MAPAAMAEVTLSRRARTRTLRGVQVLATGSYLPSEVVTNQDLSQRNGFDADWVYQRTGIRSRRHASPHEATSDLCYEAALACLESARVDRSEIDLVVVGTFTPDMCFPSTACLLQNRLGLTAAAMDLQAACAGFMYALVTGAQFVATGCSRLALVVGGDCNSRIINPQDQKTYPLFGDGAGAVLLGRGSKDQGLLAYQLGADGAGGDLLCRPACGSRMPPTPEALAEGLHYMHMDGKAVFKWAINILNDSIEEVLRVAKLDVSDVALLIPHQANIRIIRAAASALNFKPERIFNNLDRYGNTSAGSIPIALDEAASAGLLQRGDAVLISGFGAGLAWGTAVLRW